MAISVLQTLATTASVSTGTTKQTAAFGSPTTNGSKIIFAVATEGTGGAAATVSSATDTNGNTYTIDGANDTFATNHDRITILSSNNTSTGASNKITVNTTNTCFITILGAIEVSGLANSSYLDNSSAGAAGVGGTTPSVGSWTTANANDLLMIAYASGSQTAAAGTPTSFNRIAESHSSGTNEDGQSDYQIVSSTQSAINPTWGNTSAGRWVGLGVAYEASGNAPAANGNFLAFM